MGPFPLYPPAFRYAKCLHLLTTNLTIILIHIKKYLINPARFAAMKKLILSFALLTFGLAATRAQSYDFTGGVRLGTDWGISSQIRLAKKTTAELILQSSLQREEVLITALAEQHSPLISRRFNFYAGGGLHKGWNSATNEITPIKDPFGVTLIAGAEFTLARLNISWDFKPAINLVGGEKKIYTQTGVSLRYVIFKKNHFQKQRKRNQRQKRREERRENRQGFNWRFWEKKEN